VIIEGERKHQWEVAVEIKINYLKVIRKNINKIN
jgi:hypothetical protein